MMVPRLEVDGDDFESGNEIFPKEKTRGEAKYRYCDWNGGLGRWTSWRTAVDGGRRQEVEAGKRDCD